MNINKGVGKGGGLEGFWGKNDKGRKKHPTNKKGYP